MEVGDTASRTKTVTARDHIDWRFTAPVHPDDTITATVEVMEVREDKPITKLACRIANEEGATVLEGTALVWREPIG